MSEMQKEKEVERDLLRIILKYGNQCISQVSLKTGYGIKALEEARDKLIEKKLIRKVSGQKKRDDIYYSFEANI